MRFKLSNIFFSFDMYFNGEKVEFNYIYKSSNVFCTLDTPVACILTVLQNTGQVIYSWTGGIIKNCTGKV